MFPVSLISFSRSKQGFRLSLEKTLELPLLVRVTPVHTSLSWRAQLKHGMLARPWQQVVGARVV